MAVPAKALSAPIDWHSEEMYVIYDPTYTQTDPAHICLACKATRLYYTFPKARSNDSFPRSNHSFPHAKTCRHVKSDFYSGYVIGPFVTSSISSFPKFQEVMALAQRNKLNSSQTFGPYKRYQILHFAEKHT